MRGRTYISISSINTDPKPFQQIKAGYPIGMIDWLLAFSVIHAYIVCRKLRTYLVFLIKRSIEASLFQVAPAVVQKNLRLGLAHLTYVRVTGVSDVFSGLISTRPWCIKGPSRAMVTNNDGRIELIN